MLRWTKLCARCQIGSIVCSCICLRMARCILTCLSDSIMKRNTILRSSTRKSSTTPFPSTRRPTTVLLEWLSQHHFVVVQHLSLTIFTSFYPCSTCLTTFALQPTSLPTSSRSFQNSFQTWFIMSSLSALSLTTYCHWSSSFSSLCHLQVWMVKGAPMVRAMIPWIQHLSRRANVVM